MDDKVKQMTIIERMQAVTAEIKGLVKDMTVSAGTSSSYKATSHTAVILAINSAEQKFGLFSTVTSQELIKSEMLHTTNTYGKEVVYHIDNIKINVRIYKVEDTSCYIDTCAFGKGIDTQDKGFGKAATYALKYALLGAYKLPTGADPDAFESKPMELEPVPDEQKMLVLDYLARNNDYWVKLQEHWNISTTKELTPKHIETIHTNLVKAKKL